MTPNSATSRSCGEPGCIDVMSTSASVSVPGVTPARLSQRAGQAPGWSLAAALAGFFMVTLDAVIVNVALPDIRRELAGGMSGLQWVVDGYTLMFAALLLSSGSLSDRLGARRAFGAGMVVFVIASAACGLAPSLGLLVAARFAQGAAAAALMPSSMALISHAYPDPTRRARAVALWSMGGVAASVSGPVLGGLLTLVSWRLIFFVNVPAGVAALALLGSTARSPHHDVPFDWAGQVAAVLGMGGLTYGAIETGAAGVTSPRVLVAFTVAVVALAAFVLLQARGRHPMVPLDLFRSRTVSVTVVVGFAFVAGYYGLPFVMSLYLQQLRGLSALGTGIAFLPMMLTGAILTPFIAGLAERFGARTLVTAGLICMTAGLTVISQLPALGAGRRRIRADDAGRGGRAAGDAAGDGAAAARRACAPGGGRQRGVQYQPAGRRSHGDSGVRRAAGRPGGLPAWSAGEPARRGRHCPGRCRHQQAAQPLWSHSASRRRRHGMSTWTEDEAYRGKYARYGRAYVEPMTAAAAAATTLLLAPSP
jgi:MFS transporter, DHA2 family, methylenomycin A resistance protein